jgi:hypothetical protein
MIFGDFRTDLVNVLAIPLGRAKAEATVEDAFQEIRAQARTGAMQAVPEIEKKVKRIVIPALVVGGLGCLLGLAGLISARRARRKAKS